MNEGFEFTFHALKSLGARFRFGLGLLDRARERMPEKVSVAWDPVVARCTATSREGEAGRRRRRGERGSLVSGKEEAEAGAREGGVSRARGERENKGYAKLPFCPSLLSFIYSTVQT